MMRHRISRSLWLAATAALIVSLLWLDDHRGGPASMLSRCSLLLSRSGSPAADVLVIGSSRTGVAIDPVAMEKMLTFSASENPPSVERLVVARNPLRASLALLDNYMDLRGPPRVIVLEIMFMTSRSVEHMAEQELNLAPEQYLFRRDMNLMNFGQILRLPSVAMPFSEDENLFNLWRVRLRGAVLRAGALAYEFLRSPGDGWSLSACDRDAWTREPEWPLDFAFSFGNFEPGGPPETVIEAMEAELSEAARGRALDAWQTGVSAGQPYPYDFGQSYRSGEVAMLKKMLEMAARNGVPVVLLPLPLYGSTIAEQDMRDLQAILPPKAHVFDLYGHIRGDLDKFWYDDAHIDVQPAGVLATAILADHLQKAGLLNTGATEFAGD